MWHGHLPTVKHFRIFGSTRYDLIPAWAKGGTYRTTAKGA